MPKNTMSLVITCEVKLFFSREEANAKRTSSYLKQLLPVIHCQETTDKVQTKPSLPANKRKKYNNAVQTDKLLIFRNSDIEYNRLIESQESV